MNKKLIISIVVILLFIVGILFLNNRTPEKSTISEYDVVTFQKSGTQKYLTDTKGRTLYTFLNDEHLKSNCVNKCLEQWPVFEFNNRNLSLAKDPLSKQLNIIKRADGFYQYAYGPHPLYYHEKDKQMGDKNGDGFEGVWSIIIIP